MPSLASMSPSPQIFETSKTLPYPLAPIYTTIADVSSYSSFLPYCLSSTVTTWSSPDAKYNKKWPSVGKLVVGYGQLTEEFTSRVYCIPGRVVESVGGMTKTSLDAKDISHHLQNGERIEAGKEGEEEEGLLEQLRSRWTVEELGKEKTKVTLALEYAFTNPLYTALSGGAAPKVADKMVQAFEERVRYLLERDPEMRGASLEELDGSRVKRR